VRERAPFRVTRVTAVVLSLGLGASCVATNVDRAGAAAPYGAPCLTADELKAQLARGSPASSAQHPIRVMQICIDAATAAATNRTVYVAPPSGPANDQAKLTDGELFDSGTTFSTPAGTGIDFALLEANIVRVQSGSRFTINASPQATAIDLILGKLRFIVQEARKAFDVKGDHVVAGVSGTEFGLEVVPGQSETYDVTQGSVVVTRSLTIHLEAEKRDVAGIRESTVISADGTPSVTYALPFPLFKTFANAAEAREFFTQELRDATASGDKPAIENALSNIDLVNAPFAAAAPPSGIHAAAHLGASSIVAGVVGAAILSGLAVTVTAGHTTSPVVATPGAATLLPGTVTLMGHAVRPPRGAAFQIAVPIRLGP